MFTFIGLSCQKKEIKQKNKNHSQERIVGRIEFPDTVLVNKSYDGVVKYRSLLDTVTTNFDDKKKDRYVILYLATINKPYEDYKELKKKSKKFGADNNREISFYDIKFDKVGTYYLDGIINDYVVIDINKKDTKGNDLVREIENEERVTRKVVVVNSLKDKQNFKAARH
jgi:hypothetical protein